MSLRAHIIERTSEFLALREPWNEIQASGPEPSPFLTWEWMYAWWLHYGFGDPRQRLAIVAVREGRDLVALLPGYVREALLPGGLTTFSFLGTPHESSDYLDVIQRDPARTDTIEVAVRTLQAQVRPDRVTLGNVLTTSATALFLQASAPALGVSFETHYLRTCPYLPIAGDWAAFERSLSSNFRQLLRRRTRRFFERQGAEFGLVEDRAELPAAVQTLFDLHQRRFAHKNEATGFEARHRGRFHEYVSKWLFDANLLRFFRLQVEGRTVATLYCFESAGRLFYYQGGIDPAWDRESVGTVLMGQVIKYAFERQLVMFDFMRGSEAYKFRWTRRTRDIVVLDVGVTPLGKGLVAVTRGAAAARQRLKSFVQSVRRHPVPAVVASEA
jgi:CelD/BcsL family acetyltransferase involved in cellulose biosynthesis